jgi:hypothetical protein
MVAPDGGYLGGTGLKKGRSFSKAECADFVMYIPKLVGPEKCHGLAILITCSVKLL